MRFEWDPRKAASNLIKHGVSFAEAATAFGDPFGRIVDDPVHAIDEPRFVLLGQSERHRLVVVMFTERGESIRIVSARRATSRERKDYAKG